MTRKRDTSTAGLAAALFAGTLCLLAPGPAAAADAEKGREFFKACKACHTLAPGRRKIGPSLHGIFGRKAGTVEAFNYSKAMRAADITWTDGTLRAYIRNSRQYIKGTRMVYRWLGSEQDLDDLMAYLKEATK